MAYVISCSFHILYSFGFRVKTIAIGNGKGCRLTEKLISNMIQAGSFKPVNVRYCIISEQGVSIYSVSDTAIREMPSLDPTLRSAVSLARRLQVLIYFNYFVVVEIFLQYLCSEISQLQLFSKFD